MTRSERLRRLFLEHPEPLLAVFCIGLGALNLTRLQEWGVDGFRVYLSHAIMQTTLFDFAWILAILAVFIADDAHKLRLRWSWVLLTFPFMPTLGILVYFILRKRALLRDVATTES